MRHLDLITGDSSLTAQTAARALSEARSAQTTSIGSVAVRNQDGTYTTIGAQAAGGSGIDLGSTGDLTWRDGTVQHSARRLQLQLSEVQQKLAGGGHISSATGGNHISLSAPNTTEGYADGAFWTRVASATDMTVRQVWKKVDGAWVEQDVSKSTLIAPTIDAGLISVASLAAKMIVSGEMWSSATNPRYGITKDGFLGYDQNGNETVHIDGQDNRIAGTATLGGLTMKHWSHENDTEGTSALFRDTDRRGPDAPESYALTQPGLIFQSHINATSGQLTGSTGVERAVVMHNTDYTRKRSSQVILQSGSTRIINGAIRGDATAPDQYDADRVAGIHVNERGAMIHSNITNVFTGTMLNLGSDGTGALRSIHPGPGGQKWYTGFQIDPGGDMWFGEFPAGDGTSKFTTSTEATAGLHLGTANGVGYLDMVGRLGTSFDNSTFKTGEWTQWCGELQWCSHRFSLPWAGADSTWMPLISAIGGGSTMPRASVTQCGQNGVSVSVYNAGETGVVGACCLFIRVPRSEFIIFGEV